MKSIQAVRRGQDLPALDATAANGDRYNNTEVRQTAQGWELTLHGHKILARGRVKVILREGAAPVYCDTLTIDLCGWNTVTTRDRLNRFLPNPLGVYNHKRVPYLGGIALAPSERGLELPTHCALVIYDHPDYGWIVRGETLSGFSAWKSEAAAV